MKVYVLIFVMAAVTYIIRALPITVFQKEIKSKWLKSFLYYVPYTVLGAMTFPAILFSTGSILTACFGLLCAVVVAYFNKGLMAAAVISVVTVYISSFLV